VRANLDDKEELGRKSGGNPLGPEKGISESGTKEGRAGFLGAPM
jgi:hypothetical protein